MKKTDLIAPFGFLYGAVAEIRRTLYEKGVFKSYDLGAPTVSVGNITFGGTGKTPLVALIAEILAARDEKVCILTRGYRRENERARILVSDGEKILADAKKAGDEPLELAEKLLGKAIVVADANRARAGIWARQKFGVTVFILDDGFQHLKVKRDLDIVCVDATNPFGEILRESLNSLRRADAVVITRANLIENIAGLKAQISKFVPPEKIFVSENVFNSKFKIQDLDSVAAFCALGNPENFFAQLKREGFNLVFTQTFPDHYFYAPNDVEKLEKKAKIKGARCLVTTAKDAVKLKNFNFEIPLAVAESNLVFEDGVAFRKLILDRISDKKYI